MYERFKIYINYRLLYTNMNHSQLRNWPFRSYWLGKGKYNKVEKMLYCGTPVAMKTFINPEYESSEDIKRIKLNEIHMLETLSHPKHLMT